MYGFYKTLVEVQNSSLAPSGDAKWIDEGFNHAMDDDFNTAKALADLFGIFKGIKSKLKAGDGACVSEAEQVKKTYSLLGLFREDPGKFVTYYEQKQAAAMSDVPSEVLELVEQRKQAKLEKNWQKPMRSEARSRLLDTASKTPKTAQPSKRYNRITN